MKNGVRRRRNNGIMWRSNGISSRKGKKEEWYKEEE